MGLYMLKGAIAKPESGQLKANTMFVSRYLWCIISVYIGKGKQCQLSSACPKVHQEELGRDTMEPGEMDALSLVTHREGKFPSKKSGDIFTLLAASLPFKRETNIQELQRGLFFHPTKSFHGFSNFHNKTIQKP